MTPEERGSRTPGAFDPEAEQEVDFSRYGRVLLKRWWLVAGAVVVGAILGYAVSLGGNQVFKATASVYLGQPYSASGNIPLQSLQTNPSTVETIAHSEAVDEMVAARCDARSPTFQSGIASQAIAGSLSKNGQNPLIAVSVQAKTRKLAACAANGLARAVVDRVAPYANVKIAGFRRQIDADRRAIASIEASMPSPRLTTTDRLLLQVQLRTFQTDQVAATQLLQQAEAIEAPRIVTPAAGVRVTARSRRTTVVVASIIGVLLGVFGAFGWDRMVTPRKTPL